MYYPKVAEFFLDLKRQLAASGSQTTLRHLAAAWGVSTAAVNSWERGTRAPQLRNVVQIATVIYPDDPSAQTQFIAALQKATKENSIQTTVEDRLFLRFYHDTLSEVLKQSGFESTQHKALLTRISILLPD